VYLPSDGADIVSGPPTFVLRPSLPTGAIIIFLLSSGMSLAAEPLQGSPPGDLIRSPSTVEVQAGEEYGGGTRIRIGAAGVSFVIPRDWSGGLPPDSAVFILGPLGKPGFGLVFFLRDVSAEDIAARMSVVQPFAHDLMFEPTGPVKTVGTRLEAAYAGGDMIGRALALMGPSHNGVLYFLGSRPEEAAALDRLLEELAASTVFETEGSFEPPAP
jgi:hypothetical protein